MEKIFICIFALQASSFSMQREQGAFEKFLNFFGCINSESSQSPRKQYTLSLEKKKKTKAEIAYQEFWSNKITQYGYNFGGIQEDFIRYLIENKKAQELEEIKNNKYYIKGADKIFKTLMEEIKKCPSH